MTPSITEAHQKLQRNFPHTDTLKLLEKSDKTIEDLKAENDMLKKELAVCRTAHTKNSLPRGDSESNTPAPASVSEPLRELEFLRSRYARLLKEKERLEAQYQADYRKWRAFKTWVLTGSVSNTLRPAHNPPTPASILKLAVQRRLPRLNAASRDGSTPSLPDFIEGASKPYKTSVNIVSSPLPLLPYSQIAKSKAADESSLDSSAPHKKLDRYAEEIDDSEEAINAQYRIDPARNSGVAYQFNEAVRHKHERQHLAAEDCDCCHEYYDAIEPLPELAQRPLWRSPPKTPKKQIQGRHSHISPQNDSGKKGTDRKNDISKHRRQWAAPKTPPGYWDIGFPDTQEAADINKRAEVMHKRKRQDVEDEVK
ncbi:hypothetical protein NM688_g807 [Phlebia brevispora]|uniref:Uncharacterized protein n=1 Tax=Phlebia brevispora TaxID=194682 RepID=A0ACC1TDE4_9APHY|nr:hypothetical protein NM688_g807 [Phlebia brevispora]